MTVPTAKSSFFRELNLALAHRVVPDANYMAMTAYFDESGTHGDQSPAIVVAGFGATVAQWVGFEKRLNKLFADFNVETLRAKDFLGTKKDFAGWSLSRKGAFNYRLLTMMDDQLSFAVAGIVSPADYQTYYRSKPFPRGVRPDTAYAICFRTALVRSFLNFHDRPADWPLNVVLELGHPNWKDAARVFEEVAAEEKFVGMLGTVTFATKKDCRILASADSFAHSIFRDYGGYSERSANPVRVTMGPSEPPYDVHKLKMSRTLLEKRGLGILYRAACARKSLWAIDASS